MKGLPEGAIDLGGGSWYTKVWDKNATWIAIEEWHFTPTGALCGGWVPFDVPSQHLVPNAEKWTVVSYEPLELSPSLLCRSCNHHGFIRRGKWEAV